jgi:hypothetical protein
MPADMIRSQKLAGDGVPPIGQGDHDLKGFGECHWRAFLFC